MEHPGIFKTQTLKKNSSASLRSLVSSWSGADLLLGDLGGQFVLVTAVALAMSLLTLYSMTKIWNEAFWKEAPGGAAATPLARVSPLVITPIAALALVTVAIGLGAGPVFDRAGRAAEQLADPPAYVTAVLGPQARR